MRMILYGVMVGCFAVAGIWDIIEGQPRLGVISLLVGAANALVFMVRG